ncbi:glutathione-dependent reductase [Amylibacter marinus]|uniref:Glutathione-dependent reductase n=1 Tax=Amylibacter marinus TaxID=1475483 RepID=A0ABQ5VY60_9RHOB|nr:glutathione S-transferase family protein [Amylibacter marinus]GLQ36152.1 glutathione-dependent reductase [Amylibacter marinus]
MGLLQDGRWVDQWYDTSETGGRFIRKAPQFRNWITADGSAGPGGDAGFMAEPDRYHLYVSLACPWAHRTLIFRALKGLEKMVPISVVHWYMAENGWTFQAGDGVIDDPIHNARYMYEIYTAAAQDYSGRVTVPVLWDKKTQTIVSNESPEIIRMFNSAFDGIGAKPGDFYPEPLRGEIDTLNERIYDTVNNGVYKAGFATTQEAYDEAVAPLFATIDWLDQRLERQRYLCGNVITEADWRLFTTLVRFDAVYVAHFKCNIRRISDYANLSGYLRDLYQQPGIAETVNMEHIKNHYYASQNSVNPTRIIPKGPFVDFTSPHDRARLG